MKYPTGCCGEDPLYGDNTVSCWEPRVVTQGRDRWWWFD